MTFPLLAGKTVLVTGARTWARRRDRRLVRRPRGPADRHRRARDRAGRHRDRCSARRRPPTTSTSPTRTRGPRSPPISSTPSGVPTCMQEAGRIMVGMPADSNRSMVVVSSIRRPLASARGWRRTPRRRRRSPSWCHGGLRAGAARNPGECSLAGDHRHAFGGSDHRGHSGDSRRAIRRRTHGPPRSARGDGQRRPLPVPSRVVRHRHEHDRRRRRASLDAVDHRFHAALARLFPRRPCHRRRCPA